MNEIFNNIKNNYENINFSNIRKIKTKTINDIFFIDDKYVLKIYTLDDEKQVITSIKTQKKIHDLLGISPNIILNKKGEIITKHENKICCMQEFIEPQENKVDIIEKVAKELTLMHHEFKSFDYGEYKYEKKYKSFQNIEEDIIKNKEQIDRLNTCQDAKKVLNILLDKRLEYLKKYKCEYRPEKYQIIHGDIRPSNIICNNDKAYFIDFDFTSCGDLLFEIGSAAMLISDFNLDEAIRFLQIYNQNSKEVYLDKIIIFNNLLSYYVQSSFPMRLIGKIDDMAVKKMAEGRIACLEFCNKILERECI